MPKVVKKDKVVEDFNAQKVFRSCVKAGATETVANQIAAEAERQARDGMPTRMIRAIILKELEAKAPKVAEKYCSFNKHAAQKIVVRCNYV